MLVVTCLWEFGQELRQIEDDAEKADRTEQTRHLQPKRSLKQTILKCVRILYKHCRIEPNYIVSECIHVNIRNEVAIEHRHVLSCPVLIR